MVTSSKNFKKQNLPHLKTGSFEALCTLCDDVYRYCVVEFSGSLTGGDVSELVAFLDAIASLGGQHIIYKMTALCGFGPLAWGELCSDLQRYKKRGGTIYLWGITDTVMDTMKIMHADKLFIIKDSIEDAAADIEQIGSFEKNIDSAHGELEMSISWMEPYTIEQKIEKIVANDCSLSALHILKKLKSADYGNVRIGYISLLFTLQSMKLSSRKLRERFSRSA